MYKLNFYLFALLLLATSCVYEDEISEFESDNAEEEFIAPPDTFLSYRDWEILTQLDSALIPVGEQAHTNSPRTIFTNNINARRGVTGEFPIGTIHLKQVENLPVVVAMAKRGGQFNVTGNGWEWFMLDTTGVIQQRGAMLNCIACHAAHAQNTDFAFLE